MISSRGFLSAVLRLTRPRIASAIGWASVAAIVTSPVARTIWITTVASTPFAAALESSTTVAAKITPGGPGSHSSSFPALKSPSAMDSTTSQSSSSTKTCESLPILVPEKIHAAAWSQLKVPDAIPTSVPVSWQLSPTLFSRQPIDDAKASLFPVSTAINSFPNLSFSHV
jgi:hypothetical protein